MPLFKFVAVLAFLLAQLCDSAFGQVALPPTPPVKLAVNPVTNKVYVTNTDADTVTAYDIAAGTSVTIPVQDGPQFIAVNPATNKVYVNNARTASLTVIDGATDTVINHYPIGSLGPIVINPVTNIVYIVRMTSAARDEVTFFNANNNTWYSIALLSYQPSAMAVNPVTDKIFTANYATGDVRIINGAMDGNDHPASVAIGVWSKPYAIAVNPVTNKAYVLTEDSRGPIAVIDAATNTAVNPPVTAGHGVAPKAIAVDPVSNKAYAAFAGEIIVIDGATNALTYIPISGAASGNIALAINHSTNRLYVATASGTLHVIDGQSNTILSTESIPVGTSIVGVNPVTDTAYFFDTALSSRAGSGTARALPVTTTITPLPGDSASSSGTITLDASSSFSPARPAIRKVYYQLDSRAGRWTAAAGSGPYTASFSGLSPGSHTLHAFAVDGQDTTLSTGPQVAPLIGQVASYTFTVAGVPKADPSISLASSANPADVGQSVTFTASVSGSSGTPTGSVTFLDGSTALCSAVAMSGGSATCATSSLAAGAHTVTAQYSGDDAYNGATSGSITQTVDKLVPSVALSSSANPSTGGQNVTFTASLGGSGATPTGTATFMNGATAIAGCSSVTVSGGTASCATAALATGTHSITVQYSGDARYNGATSSAVSQVVNAKATASVTVTSSANPATVGQAVTFTANVSGPSGTPTGTVTFLDGTSALCSAVALGGGAATCATSALSAGTHNITAQYSGDASYAPATSAALSQAIDKLAASVSVTSSANPSTSGQAITLSVSVSGSGAAPTGTATFLDGGAPISGCTSVAIASGATSCATSALSVGTHAITVQYSGDARHNSSTSAALSQVVNAAKVAATFSLTSSANPSRVGQGVTFTASLGGSAGVPTGTVTFRNGGTPISGCSAATLSGGSASCATSALSQGSHSITVQYSGDTNYDAGTSSALTQMVNAKVAATLALGSSLNPSASGQSVTFSATVTGGAGTATGTVAFLDGASAIAGCASVTLAAGSASCATSALSTGTHSITAQYSGDTNYNGATSSALSQTVNAAKVAPTVALASSPNPSNVGQGVTLTASVAGSAGAASGTVTFRSGAATIAGCSAVTLSSGSAACVTSALAAGTHAISAQYSGDDRYNAAGSNTVSQTVVAPKATPQVALASSPNPATAGETVTFTVNVSGGAGTATGQAAFHAGATVIPGCDAVPLSAGAGSCATSALGSGTHSITVQYSGDASYNAATSAPLTQSISEPAPAPAADLALSQTASAGSVEVGSEVVFAITVTNLGASAASGVAVTNVIPSGASFVSASAPCTLTSGTLSCSLGSLAAGQARAFNVALRAEAAGTLTNRPSASANEADPSTGNNASSLAVRVNEPSRPTALYGLSTRMQVLTGDNVLIGGFIIGGSAPKTVVVRARGPSLTAAGIGNPLPNPTLTLVRASDQEAIATNDDWGTAPNAAQLSASGFAPNDPLESAVLATLNPGAYTVVVAGAGGSTGVGIVEIYEVDNPAVPLAGISTRGQVLTGNDVMIGGFVIQGSTPQTVIVRARGPSLRGAGVADALANPKLQLVRASDNTTVALNDDWGSAANAAQLAASGFAPGDALEAAMLVTLEPGAYTALVMGADGGTGVGIVEVYPAP